MKLYPEAFNLYAERSGRLRTKASRASFRSVLSQLQSRYPNHRVDQFTPRILTEFCLQPGLAPNSIKHRRTILRSFFDWAEYQGLVKSSPAGSLRYSVVPGNHTVRASRWLTEAQVVEAIKACPTDLQGQRDRLILLFGFLMGLRIHEIAGLRWSDLSSDYATLQVTGKGQKLAQMGVPPQLQEALQAWRHVAPADAVAILPGMKEIFSSDWTGRSRNVDWTKPMGITGIRQAVLRAGERVGIPFRPHDMRRTLGGILEAKDVQLPDIQRALRHSNVGTTSVYLDKNPAKAAAVTGGLTIGL
jgi:integrase/recombinase XerD